MVNYAGLKNVARHVLLGSDWESGLVSRYAQTAFQSGLCSHPAVAINLYIALKAKPLSIVYGSSGERLLKLVKHLAGFILGRDGNKRSYHQIDGHPWNAEASGDMAFFSSLHSRFLTEKFFSILEEAIRPENSNTPYFFCLDKISPAEIPTLLSETSYQLDKGHLMQFAGHHLPSPLDFPTNFFILATLQQPAFSWWDPDLLLSTTVPPCIEPGKAEYPYTSMEAPCDAIEKLFLTAQVREEQAVFSKLHTLLSWKKEPFNPVFRFETLLEKNGIELPATGRKNVMTYLANAWCSNGTGLFHRSTAVNLQVALDWAFAQYLLPWLVVTVSEKDGLKNQLRLKLANKFPVTTHSLAQWVT